MTIVVPQTVINGSNSEEKSVPVSSSPLYKSKAPSELKILVIEDNEVERALISKYLNTIGYKTEFASNGEDGLVMALKTHPDVILLDIFLPGINGWDVLHALKQNPKTWDINVVMISMLDEKNKGYLMGATDYLVKPFDQKQLDEALSRYITNNKIDVDNFGRVLIVDDNEDARIILKNALQKFKLQIDEATNGVEALEAIAKNKPSLILLDLMMPIMDGFEVIDNLRKSEDLSNIPVIINTAKILSETDKAKLSGSITKILYKSQYSTQDLLQEIKNILTNINALKNKVK